MKGPVQKGRPKRRGNRGTDQQQDHPSALDKGLQPPLKNLSMQQKIREREKGAQDHLGGQEGGQVDRDKKPGKPMSLFHKSG